MELFTENTLDLAAAPAQVGNDDANSELRSCSVRLVFQNAARPLGSGTDFTTGIDQAQANGVDGDIGEFALSDFRPTPGEGAEQSLLGRRWVKKSCNFDMFGDRDFSPFDEICDKRRKFSAR